VAWSHEADCPDEALFLLAALHAQRDEADEAVALIKRVRPDTTVGQRAVKLLISVMTTKEWTEAARTAAVRLFDAQGFHNHVKAWLSLMRVPGSSDLPSTPRASVEHLAVELLEDLSILPSIVAGITLAHSRDDLELLRESLQRIERDICTHEEQLTLYTAAAELALLDQANEDAQRWASRGLMIAPYNAKLALLLNQAAASHSFRADTNTDLVLQSLRDAAEKHPAYPDVRAALIRREFVCGDVEAAKSRLSAWLSEEPGNPLALELDREQAA